MRTFITSLKIFLFFTLLTGIIYPLFVTGIAQIFFRDNANGSILRIDGKAIGSTLIGQQFDSAKYFSSRPSANGYLPFPSGGSNYGVTNDKLRKIVAERKRQFYAFNQLDEQTEIPSEMLFASGSGLDPHISPKAALLQVERIVKVRNLTVIQKEKLIRKINLENNHPQYGIFGKDCVNVLILNIELDQLNSQVDKTN